MDSINNNKKRLSSSSQDSSQDDNGHETKKIKLLSPLEKDTTLAKILSFLGVKDLKNCRLVSKKWSIEGGKHLLQKFGLRVGSYHPVLLSDKKIENAKKEKAKKQVNGIKKLLQLTDSKTWTLQVENCDMYQVIYNIPIVYNRVQKLIFNQRSAYYPEEYVDFLAQGNLILLLEQLPHLEVLESLVFVEIAQDYVVFRNSDSAALTFSKFVKKIESLRELRLDFNMSPRVFKSFIKNHNSLNAIRRIQINNDNRRDIPIILKTYVDSQADWGITQLSLTLVPYLTTKLSRKFLSKLSSTVRKLNLKINSYRALPRSRSHHFVDYNDELELVSLAYVKSDEYSFIPKSLEFLESLSIYGDEPNSQQKLQLINTLLVALRLPSLKKLVLGYLPFENMKDITWLEEDNGSRRIPNSTVNSSYLEELELIGPARHSHQLVIAISNKSRNLKGLKMDLPYPSDFPESFFNCRLTKLERLDLTLDLLYPWSVENISLYEEWLTGVQRPNDYERGEIPYTETTSGFYFRHLQNLKHLTFRGPRESNLKPPFTDFLIYNGFMLMKNIQSLNFFNVEFGAEALNDLENSVEPYGCVTVNFF